MGDGLRSWCIVRTIEAKNTQKEQLPEHAGADGFVDGADALVELCSVGWIDIEDEVSDVLRIRGSC